MFVVTCSPRSVVSDMNIDVEVGTDSDTDKDRNTMPSNVAMLNSDTKKKRFDILPPPCTTGFWVREEGR